MFGQETVEVRYTKGGVSHSVEVNRNIRRLYFDTVILGSATRSLKKVYSEKTSAEATLANTNKIIAVALHPRALGMAAWTSFANNEFARVPLGQMQMSYFTDPLTGFPFRLDLWYDPDLQKYKMRCSARFGFSNIDWRAATLLFKA